MRVVVYTRGGLLAAPVVLEATQVLVEQSNGTVVAAAAEYGPDGSVAVAHCADPDFNEMLDRLGVGRATVCDAIQLPRPPAGARLVAGPGAAPAR